MLVTMFDSANRLSLEVLGLKPACSWSEAKLRLPPSLIAASPPPPPPPSPPPPHAAAIRATPTSSAAHRTERKRCTTLPPVRAGRSGPRGPHETIKPAPPAGDRGASSGDEAATGLRREQPYAVRHLPPVGLGGIPGNVTRPASHIAAESYPQRRITVHK